MKILFNSLLVLVAAALGLALGFALRGKRTPEATAGSPVVTAVSSPDLHAKTGHVSRQRTRVRLNDDSPLATQLERDLSMSTGVTRWLYWLEAVEKATPEDFPRLFRLAQNNPAASRLVSDRWIELHPRHVFDTVIAALKEGRGSSVWDLAHRLFREWPKRDADAAIAALSAPGESRDFGSWRSTVAGEVIRKDPERGLRLFSEWHIGDFGPHMDGVAKWAATDPRRAAEVALENPSGYVSRLAMETIGKEWAKTDPARALEFAASKPGQLGAVLAGSALKEWAGQNLNQAADWLATTDERTRNRLSPSFVESWAKTDATAALTWCESNLSGSSLAQGVGGVMRGAAEKDAAAAAALVVSLNPSAARAEAAVAVGKKWFPDRLGEDIPVNPAAVAWLSALDAESAGRVLSEVQWTWATCDPKSMAAFLASSNERFSTRAYSILAQQMVRKDPIEALEWTRRLPEDRGLSAGADAFGEWRSSQPDAAKKWLDELPQTDPRRVPYLESAIRVLAWQAQSSGQLAGLTASERAVAQGVIEGMKLPEDRRTRLLEMLKP